MRFFEEKLLVIFILLLVVFFALVDAEVFGSETPVAFPDPNLEQAIRDAIDKPTGDIHQSGLLGLTELHAYRREISDLTGLEHCTGITNLYLYDNQLRDISPLARLTNLTWLYLLANQISDISALAGLTNLTALYLSSSQITDVRPLATLTELRRLSLRDNRIADLSPLAGLINLTVLKLSSNEISDFSPLAELTNLTRLYMGRNRISDTSSLARLTNLTTLILSVNEISDLSALAGLTNLTELYLEENQISNISPLARLTNLSWLSLGYNQITSLQTLVDNPGLGADDEIGLQNNYLDLSSGSDDMEDIQKLVDRGVQVQYKPQKEPYIKNTVLFTDSLDDAPLSFLDIKGVTITQIDGRHLRFEMELAGTVPLQPADYLMYLWSLDSDRDPSTGSCHDGIGAEFNLRVAYDPDPSHGGCYGWHGWIDVMLGDGSRPEVKDVEYSGNVVAMTVDVVNIDNSTSFNLTAHTGYKAQGDKAPDSGFASFPEQSDTGKEISRAMKCDVTGNYYQLVRKDLTWEEAKTYAEGLEPIEETGGLLYFPHLATITSPRENSWIIENLLVPTGTDDVYPWLGGYQAEGYDNPAEEWRWITGEDWAWVNWGNDQPDDEFGQWNECYLKMFPQVRNYRWNDESIDGKSKWWVNYALIEYGREGLKPAFPEPTPAEYKPKIYIHKEEKWKLEGVYYYGPLYGYDDYAGENCYCIEYWFKFNGDGDKAGDDWEPVYVFIDSTGEVIYCASPFHYRWDSKDTEADDFDGHHVKVYFAENWHTPIVDYEDSWMKVLLFGYIEEPSKYFEETDHQNSLEHLTYKKYPHDIEHPFSPERGDWTREDWEAFPLGFKMWKTDPGGFNFAIEIKGVSLENAKQYPEFYAIQAAKWIVDNYFGLLSQAETLEGLLEQFKVPIPPMAGWTRKGIELGIAFHIRQLIVDNIDEFTQQMYIYAKAPPWPVEWWVAGASAPPQEIVVWKEQFTSFDESQYYLDPNSCACWDSRNGYFVLTPDEDSCRGRLFLKNPVIIDTFRAEFDMLSGGGTGADGLTFSFVNSYGYPPSKGGSLDFEGAQGYAVEFDTYYNSEHTDPSSENHIAVIRNSVSNHLFYATSEHLEDGQWHHVVIRFDHGHVQIFFDGTSVLDSIITDFSPFTGYFGFTAATGAYNNFHIIDNVIIEIPASHSL